jgi:hypothetical protein
MHIASGMDEIALDIEANYWPASWGDRENPPDNAEVEIVSCKVDGAEFKLSDEEKEKLENELLESMMDDSDEPEEKDYPESPETIAQQKKFDAEPY